jgi:alpha-beta hydrolase superfamily lysophospholipase
MRSALIGRQAARAVAGALLASGGLASAGAPTAQPKIAQPQAGAPAPPPVTLKALLSPPTISSPRLAPSGKAIALIRRVDDIDQILRVDLPSLKETVLFQTQALPARQIKQHFRQSVSDLEWKSDDKLLVSMSTPVALAGYDFDVEATVHMIVRADSPARPTFLNMRSSGKTGMVEFSWIQDSLKGDPAHVLIGRRDRETRIELERVDINDASRVIVETGAPNTIAFGVDRKGDIVTRTIAHDDGTLTLEGRAPGQRDWRKVFDFRPRDERALAKFDLLGVGGVGVLYVGVQPETPADGDTTVVRTFDLTTMKLGPVVWSNPTYDIDAIIQDVDTLDLIGGCYWVDTLRCDFRSPGLNAQFKALNRFFEGKRNVAIVSQSSDNTKWLLVVSGPDEPASFFVYDAVAHHIDPLGLAYPDLGADRLGTMRRLDFKARDGAPLWAYVTEPPSPPAGPLPLVVLPHGGPEARDHYDFDTLTQFLATRGYVVLQPMFRGSAGLGRKFAQAGYGQWGGLMHQDVMDAVRALIAEGRIDARRVCMVGGSYGGYEALWAAATEPVAFRCAVSLDGLSDLAADMDWEKHFGRESPRYQYWLKSIGDSDRDRAALLARSPLSKARDWSTPLLLIHGDKDAIVPVEQSRRLKAALDAAGKPVRYLEVKGMGHGPSTDDEVTKVYGAIETFLAQYLGSVAAPPAP